MRKPTLSQRARRVVTPFLLLAVALVIAVTSFLVERPNRILEGDTRATLLVSQELIQRGTVRLDHHGAETLKGYGYVIQEKDGHFYYYFPLGASLLSVPFVAVANALGYDMLDSESPMQRLLTALLLVATFLLVHSLARMFLPVPQAMPLATLCVFGTSIASTGMTTLWSHDFAVPLATLSLLLVFRTTLEGKALAPAALATCLFLAYLCRPTMAVLAPTVLLYLFCYRKHAAVKAVAWLAAMLVGFSLWSRYQFGGWLPDYYLPKRLDNPEFTTALWQNLFGPARGLFVYSPFLAPVIVLAAVLWRSDRDYARALIIGIGWPLLHLFAVSGFPHWWAGWSYGPRLMMDCLPGLFALLFLSVGKLGGGQRLAMLVLVALTGAFAIYVNTWQGLFNAYAARWNADPVVDMYPEYVSDWRYPQFLHDANRHRERLEEFNRMLTMSMDDPAARFAGWSPPQGGMRWAMKPHPSITFELDRLWTLQPRLRMDGMVSQAQHLVIRLNGTPIHDGDHANGRYTLDISLPQSLFVNGANVVAFEVGEVGAGGHRGVALKTLAIFLKE